jgi:integrase
MSLYKRPDRTPWYYEFELNNKRYRGSTGTANKREAALFEAEVHRKAREDVREQREGIKRMTLHAVAGKWLDASALNHKDHRNNESRVRKLFGDELKQKGKEWELVEGARYGLSKTLMVHEITQGTLADLKAARQGEENTPGTINREISLVQTLMGFAASLTVVMPTKPIVWSDRRNRAASLKAAERKGKLRWLSLDEEHKLLDALDAKVREQIGTDDRAAQDNFDLVVMLLDTGGRYEEIAGLRWPQVDLDAGVFDLYRSKTANESVFKMTKRVKAILQRRRKETEPRSYVFPAHVIIGHGRTAWARDDGCRGHATGSIQSTIDSLGLNDDPALDRVTPHTLRDTYASRLVQKGVSLAKIQLLLGHSSPTMTQKYAHLAPDATGAEAADVLDRIHD